MAENEQYQDKIRKQSFSLFWLLLDLAELRIFNLLTIGFNSVETTAAILEQLKTLFRDVNKFIDSFVEVTNWTNSIFNELTSEILILKLRAAEIAAEIHQITL